MSARAGSPMWARIWLRRQRVLHLYICDSLTQRQIAERLGVTVKTVSADIKASLQNQDSTMVKDTVQ